jgi:hypothetical protein
LGYLFPQRPAWCLLLLSSCFLSSFRTKYWLEQLAILSTPWTQRRETAINVFKDFPIVVCNSGCNILDNRRRIQRQSGTWR